MAFPALQELLLIIYIWNLDKMIFKKEKMPKKEGFVNNKMNFLMLILLEAVLLSFIFFFLMYASCASTITEE